MNNTDLKVILSNHVKWLNGEEGGQQANLQGANLQGANLRRANLRRANLWEADLWEVNLWEADLRGVNLWGCSGNRREIKSIFVSEVYPITYTRDTLQIGCECHPIEDWWSFSDERIVEMDGKTALTFWYEWKDTIRMIIEKSPAL